MEASSPTNKSQRVAGIPEQEVIEQRPLGPRDHEHPTCLQSSASVNAASTESIVTIVFVAFSRCATTPALAC